MKTATAGNSRDTCHLLVGSWPQDDAFDSARPPGQRRRPAAGSPFLGLAEEHQAQAELERCSPLRRPGSTRQWSARVNGYVRLLPVAEEAVARAAEDMRHRSPGALTAKGDRDFASRLDFEIEREVRDFLRSPLPRSASSARRTGSRATGEMQWVLDPIDGTANFVRGIPLCAVSLGLLHRAEAVLGVIELPFLGNRYVAARAMARRSTAAPSG